MNIFEDDHFTLSTENESVYVQVHHDGCSLKDFEVVHNLQPRIEIKNFAALQQAFSHPDNHSVNIGIWRPLIECSVSSDGMEARIRILQTQEDLQTNKELLTLILFTLERHDVREGLLMDALRGPFPAQQWFVVAKGTAPVPGDNALVNYFPVSERKPLVTSDGKTDFYNMHFIDEISIGGWLGEKTPATSGTPGRTVFGKMIPPLKGRDKPLRYDPKTVTQVQEGHKLVLRAIVEGAVEWKTGRISVVDRLVIPGDVGVGTGNIDFSGSVIIYGTVHDTFSVVAGKDISILSSMGVGAVHQIISKEGDIFLKGGVYGQGKASIEAKGSIYAKHANECSMKAGSKIHIGYYAMGSNLQAEAVILDKEKGRLIGGNILAKSQVVSAYIGNVYERQTYISIAGINRKDLQEHMEACLREYKYKLEHLDKLMRLLNALDSSLEPLTEESQKENDNVLLTKQHLENELFNLDTLIHSYAALLKTRGEGEVSIVKAAYPKTHLSIKNSRKVVDQETKGTFFSTENKLYFE